MVAVIERLTAQHQHTVTFGQCEPIMVFEGMVLDGWNRYGCLVRLGMAVKQHELPAGVDPRAFIKSRNLHRRHLTGSQRALAVVACSEWVPNGSKATPEPGSGVTEKQMAAEADVSDRTIRQAKVVVTQAAPEVVEAVKSGEMSLKAAVETTKPTVATPISMSIQSLDSKHQLASSAAHAGPGDVGASKSECSTDTRNLIVDEATLLGSDCDQAIASMTRKTNSQRSTQ
jgi:hypothetical protein